MSVLSICLHKPVTSEHIMGAQSSLAKAGGRRELARLRLSFGRGFFHVKLYAFSIIAVERATIIAADLSTLKCMHMMCVFEDVLCVQIGDHKQ